MLSNFQSSFAPYFYVSAEPTRVSTGSLIILAFLLLFLVLLAKKLYQLKQVKELEKQIEKEDVEPL